MTIHPSPTRRREAAESKVELVLSSAGLRLDEPVIRATLLALTLTP
jgi:hypothetical protein